MTMKRVRVWGHRLLATLLVAFAGLGLAGLASADGEAAPDAGAADAGARDGAEQEAADADRWALASGAPRVGVIRLEGGIMGGAQEFVLRAIERSEREGFAALVIELDTPGGILDDTQEIVKRMLSARVPVVVFVSPKGAQAASAGTFITLAGHVAAMAPGTRIGAAHPVMISYMPTMPGGGDKQEDKDAKEKRQEQEDIMMEKVTNDTVAFVTSVAKERGRNAEWAEEAVRKSVSITALEAVEKKVVDLVADDLDDLLAKLDGREIQLDAKTKVSLKTRGATLERWEPTLKQRLLSTLADPNLLWLLFLIGLGGIAMEFYHPGMIFPGAIGGLCLLLALVSMQVLPVSLGGILLVLIGLGLFVAEVYVSAFGLLAVGGALLLVLGGIMLVDPESQPYYMDPNLQVDLTVLIPTAVALGALFVGIGYFIVRAQRSRIRTGQEGMRGEVGEARTDVGPQGGKVFVHGEWWNAVSKEVIPAGHKVVVVRVENLVAFVEKHED